LGNFVPKEVEVVPQLISFEPTEPTMMIMPEFDVMTEQIIGYREEPVSTLTTQRIG
jgi:hypothetical protein